ncbi:MAG: response regulator transcription factor [Bacteroidota bacterium]|nr:response regulator transcription factor [Bacteroidota bacterium]
MSPYQLPINLLIADDHQLFTDGISKILETEKKIGGIYTAHNGREAVDKVMTKDIDCVIMDINMPILNGLEATKLIKLQKPDVKVIVVSMLSDASIVSKMMKAGADAFINKDTGKAELIKAIDKVMHGEKYISPQISNNLFTHLTDRNVNKEDTEKNLTAREVEIIRYIADGLTNHEIAEKLFLSIVTVDTHRKNMLAKLHLNNTASLVKYAADHKLL